MKLKLGDKFPDIELPDHTGKLSLLSSFNRPTELDTHLGFTTGYPLIVVFYRGFFCPRDFQQMKQLVELYPQLHLNYARLVAVSVDEPKVAAAYRAGLGAKWPFLSDHHREVANQLKIVDDTEGEYAYPLQPYSFILNPDLTIHKFYTGWYLAGRPTSAEIIQDLREVMEKLPFYGYAAWNTSEIKQVRIPQQTWLDGVPMLGQSDFLLQEGVIESFDETNGYGRIRSGELGEAIFFHFTAIPGEGYRVLPAGTRVRFEVLKHAKGRTASNIQIAE